MLFYEDSDKVFLVCKILLINHCYAHHPQELQVIGKIWSKIKIKGLDIFQKFSTVVLNYHINFDIQLRNISSVFDKYAPK